MPKVLKPFRDRETWRAYDAGDEYDGTPERIRELLGGGYVQSGLVAHDGSENGSDAPSASESASLEGLTVLQLRQLAEERGVDVPSRATKPRLLEILGA